MLSYKLELLQPTEFILPDGSLIKRTYFSSELTTYFRSTEQFFKFKQCLTQKSKDDLTETSCGAQKEGMKPAHAFNLPYLQQLMEEINIFLLKFITVSFLKINIYEKKKNTNCYVSVQLIKQFFSLERIWRIFMHFQCNETSILESLSQRF